MSFTRACMSFFATTVSAFGICRELYMYYVAGCLFRRILPGFKLLWDATYCWSTEWR